MKFKISKSQWEETGRKAGWMKKAQNLSDKTDGKIEEVTVSEEVETQNTSRIPSNLDRDQKADFDPAAQALRSKFDGMKPSLRDPKGKVVINEMFNSMTDGNKSELNKSLMKMKPILQKFKNRKEK